MNPQFVAYLFRCDPALAPFIAPLPIVHKHSLQVFPKSVAGERGVLHVVHPQQGRVSCAHHQTHLDLLLYVVLHLPQVIVEI